ncbi:LLM class flavin-dependent oxidoreductase [Streptomyces sp. NPDC021224]|uniref:LLM class flavin-dependent oxidoreductase n=1 Tax=unclassified Streptomyces TaxID=2593676 RepID=UPI0037B5EA2D
MQLGVNVPNFGPGTDPGVLREWAIRIEELGYDLLMMSDHVTVTPDVAERYPEPFYDPFTTLAWLAGLTRSVRLGTTVTVLPYRHPLLVARMAEGLQQLSGGRFVLGVGVGWSPQEFAALGVPFADRGRLTDAHLAALHEARPGGATPVPLWVGGSSRAAIRRAVRHGDAWHPLRLALPRLRATLAEHPDLPALAPRIALDVTDAPVTGPDRPAGVGTLDQIAGDLAELERLGATAVVLDPYHGDPEQTRTPEPAWQALAALAAHRRTAP